ncbi:MAG TPA: phage holin family protein [Archangium sp.]|uniref:phage holin family protein n=1 Tax=Archangium sp. TaxID=1872627 RepID=UPI002E374A88|nr:phage holin family protein [Archangium sp.]HEX5748512.1 phage holin family protein [Archangium sp.]
MSRCRGDAAVERRQAVESWKMPEKDLSTNELVRRAMSEARLLAKAELLHAKVELAQEVRAARASGIFVGGGAALALVGLALLFVAGAAALALPLWAAALLAAGVAFVLAAVLGAIAWTKLPKKPMRHTMERLSMDLDELRQHMELSKH